MNNEEETTNVLLNFYKHDPESGRPVDEFLEGRPDDSPFVHLYASSSNRAETKKMFIRVVKERFGPNACRSFGKQHVMTAFISCRVDLDEGRLIAPVQSPPISDKALMQVFANGSKVVVHQSSTGTGGASNFVHTAIMIKVEEDVWFVEVEQKHLIGRLKINTTKNADIAKLGLKTCIDNRYVPRGRLYVSDILYRTARIANKPFAYSGTGFNCDSVGTWIVSGHHRWTVMNGLCRCVDLAARYLLPGVARFWLPSSLAELKADHLEQIEDGAPGLRNREVIQVTAE